VNLEILEMAIDTPIGFSLFIGAGGIIVMALTPASSLNLSRRWWLMVGISAFLAMMLNCPMSISAFRDPAKNMLVRDAIAWTFIAGIAPVIVGAVSRLAARTTKNIWLRLAAAVLAVGTLLLTTSYILLIVHCTSGDCL